eukprot:TRINITY_DN69139_c0_g1_i1.p1 TRINITY_DN69139_c0_g1~~TRINITY_DN69139_c0_g1_i1.p1  ORF type:complete len:217 (+),score=35.73 TRINITY_DN69139_c0_g1_i1:47-697(+)
MDEVEIGVRLMDGREVMVTAARAWKVWNLRSEIWKRFHIPEFEQHFHAGVQKLRSDQCMGDLVPMHSHERLKITLVRSRVPESMSDSRAEDLWQAFLVFSRDNGDTVDGVHVLELMKFAGLFKSAKVAAKAGAFRASRFTFPDLLHFVDSIRSGRKTIRRAVAAAEPEGDDDLYLLIDEIDRKYRLSGDGYHVNSEADSDDYRDSDSGSDADDDAD